MTGSVAAPGDGFVGVFAQNHGIVFIPISQHDARQYADDALPDYHVRDFEATIFTILARALQPNKSGDVVTIDRLWNTDHAASIWQVEGNPSTANAGFSDGKGHDAEPAEANAFALAEAPRLTQLLGTAR